MPPPAGRLAAGALATYLGKVQPIIDKEAAETRALPRPAQDRAILDRYVAAVSAEAISTSALATAARNGDSAGVSQALSALRDNAAPALAAQYGLGRCNASAGTECHDEPFLCRLADLGTT